MLTMLSMIEPKKRNSLSRALRSIFPPRPVPYLEYIERIPYVRIECESSSRAINFAAVREHICDGHYRLLMPKGLHLPHECGIVPFRARTLPVRLLENLAVEILAGAPVKKRRLCVGIYEDDLHALDLIPRITSLAGEIRLYAPHGSNLNIAAEEIVRECGMPLVTGDSPDVLHPCHLIIAPDDYAGIACAAHCGIVLSPGAEKRDNININSVRINTPDCLEEIFGDEYEALDLAGAFYELGCMHSLGEIVPVAGTTCDCLYEPARLSHYLGTIAG